MSRSDRIEGNEPMLLSAVAAAEHILETYDVDIFYATHDSLEERVRQALIACHMSLDMPLALGLADEMARLLMTDGRFAAEWGYVADLVGREPLDLLSSVPWDRKPGLVLAHAALSGWDVDEPDLEYEYDERLDGARAAWAAGRYDYDLREVGVDRHPSWEGGVEDDVSFARGALICLGLQSWDDPSLTLLPRRPATPGRSTVRAASSSPWWGLWPTPGLHAMPGARSSRSSRSGRSMSRAGSASLFAEGRTSLITGGVPTSKWGRRAWRV